MRDHKKAEQARIAAATELLNRGWGLPPGHEWLMNLNTNVDAGPALVQQHIELSPEAVALLNDARRMVTSAAPPQVEAIEAEVEEVPPSRLEVLAAPAEVSGPRLVSDASDWG